MIAIEQKRETFKGLHQTGCFLLANASNAGEAKALQGMGCKALATTSAGLAAALAADDLSVSLETTLANIREICAATDLPVNADFEAGFATEPKDVASNVLLAAEAGVAGLSIEDRDGSELFDIDLGTKRITAARQALDTVDPKIILVGRSEGYLIGNPDVEATIERLVAYSDAGADVLYAPGLSNPEEIRAVVAAVAPKPLNVLLVSPEMNAQELSDLGVGRISVGGFLTTAAWRGFKSAAETLLKDGRLPPESF